MRSYSEAEGFSLKADSPAASDMRESAVDRRFDRQLAEHGPALLRLAAVYTKTPSDRDDLYQEIAIAIWRALPKFREECSERTFLYRIAHNRAIAYLASRRQMGDVTGEEQVPDPKPNPEHELAQEQERKRLFGAVRRLPISYRQVITLALEGLNYAEIADILAVSESNVGVRMNRARQMLRKLMESTR